MGIWDHFREMYCYEAFYPSILHCGCDYYSHSAAFVLPCFIVPNVELNGKILELVKTEKYIGFIANDSFNDDDYIKNEIANTYARSNTTIRRFKHCSLIDTLICTLFNSVHFEKCKMKKEWDKVLLI